MAGTRSRRTPFAVVAALFMVALALRPLILAVGPLLPAIRTDLDISFREAGLLTTVPIVCLGVFAPVGPRLAARLGPRNAVGLCVAITIAFGLARAVMPAAWEVIGLTLGIGVGVGMAGPIMPIVIRLRAPNIPGLATGAYATGMAVSGSVAAALAVPLAGPELDWRRALAIIALASMVSLVAWFGLLGPDQQHERLSTGPRVLPWRHPIGWALVVVFGLQALLYFAVATWLPSAYVERGWSAEAAGSLVGLLNAVGIGGTILVPLVADRLGNRQQQLLVVSLAILVGMVGVTVVPDYGPAWAIILGFSLGGVFPLALILPVDVADRPGEIGAAAALMLLGGYSLAAIGPVILGLARDATGNFVASLWLLVALAALLVAAAAVMTPARLRKGIRPLALQPPD